MTQLDSIGFWFGFWLGFWLGLNLTEKRKKSKNQKMITFKGKESSLSLDFTSIGSVLKDKIPALENNFFVQIKFSFEIWLFFNSWASKFDQKSNLYLKSNKKRETLTSKKGEFEIHRRCLEAQFSIRNQIIPIFQVSKWCL